MQRVLADGLASTPAERAGATGGALCWRGEVEVRRRFAGTRSFPQLLAGQTARRWPGPGRLCTASRTFAPFPLINTPMSGRPARPSSELLGRRVDYHFASPLDCEDSRDHTLHSRGCAAAPRACLVCPNLLSTPITSRTVPALRDPVGYAFGRRGGGRGSGEGCAGLKLLRRMSSQRPSACPCTCILGGPRRRCTAHRQRTPAAPSPRTA